jgi:hypothetical protein
LEVENLKHTVLIAISFIVFFCANIEVSAKGFSSRLYYGGGKHTSSHGGTYVGGYGSSHKGGHYIGPYGHHYGKHK